MRIHARTLKFAAPLAVLLAVAAMSPASAAPRAAASASPVMIGQLNTETNAATPGTKNTYGHDTLNAWAKTVERRRRRQRPQDHHQVR